MYRIWLLFSLIIFSSSVGLAADVPRLSRLFKQSFNTIYQPRFCCDNTIKFVRKAKALNIDLSRSYIARFVGSGFLETSGFYTRSNPNERVMLGYFHYVLVADGYVFDFDLNQPLVLPLNKYIRLQFTPPKENERIFGVQWRSLEQLKDWSISAYATDTFTCNESPALWEKKLGDFVDLPQILNEARP